MEDVGVYHTGCIKHIEILQKQLEEKRKEVYKWIKINYSNFVFKWIFFQLIEKEKEISNLKDEVENSLVDMIRYECGADDAERDYIEQIEGLKQMYEKQLANEKQKLNDEKLKNQSDFVKLKNDVEQVFRKHDK